MHENVSPMLLLRWRFRTFSVLSSDSEIRRSVEEDVVLG
jgi:hypothetical protein